MRVSIKQTTFGWFFEETLESPKLAVWAESSTGYSNRSKKEASSGAATAFGMREAEQKSL